MYLKKWSVFVPELFYYNGDGDPIDIKWKSTNMRVF